jgi:hypothetical protein
MLLKEWGITALECPQKNSSESNELMEHFGCMKESEDSRGENVFVAFP